MTTAAGPEYVPPTACSTVCTCPVDATDDELIMVGGHWPDCPRGAWVQDRLAAVKERIRAALPHGLGCPCVLCNPSPGAS